MAYRASQTPSGAATANRIKRSGVIDAAITQVGRKIVVDADLALELAANAKKNGKEVAS